MIERNEDIDTNEPGDLSPEDERLAERLILCNWCGRKHTQPAQSAAEHLSPTSACKR